jgi:aldehyde dehydrogenase (NAD+)
LNGEIIANVQDTSSDSVTEAIVRAKTAFLEWRSMPAPRRGELVRILGDELRSAKVALGRLVTIEAGTILSEGQGEVQEMIDICDFAVSLSRQLYGLTIASERPNHRMMEQWHPLGPVGVITSFNFPVAVWSWNAALALVCGDPVIWKPSEKTPLTALAARRGRPFDSADRRTGNRRDTGRRSTRTACLCDRLNGHGPNDCTSFGPTLCPGHSGT